MATDLDREPRRRVTRRSSLGDAVGAEVKSERGPVQAAWLLSDEVSVGAVEAAVEGMVESRN